jgi:hypothetical protein
MLIRTHNVLLCYSSRYTRVASHNLQYIIGVHYDHFNSAVAAVMRARFHAQCEHFEDYTLLVQHVYANLYVCVYLVPLSALVPAGLPNTVLIAPLLLLSTFHVS